MQEIVEVWVRRLKETSREVHQHHLWVVVEGSISLRYRCVPAAVMSLRMQLCTDWSEPAVRRDAGKRVSLCSAQHTHLLRLLGPPQCLLSSHPLMLTTRCTHVVTHARV